MFTALQDEYDISGRFGNLWIWYHSVLVLSMFSVLKHIVCYVLNANKCYTLKTVYDGYRFNRSKVDVCL